jgi:lysozyme family protein
MADFEKAYKITLDYEGGYSNRPNDAGGETYKGISRKNWPNWGGWSVIDLAKMKPNFPKNLDNDDLLVETIKIFYVDNFWNQFWGDDIPDQEVANELFDTGVNQGVRTAVKYLQEGLNLLNRNQKNYPDIVEDGIFGNNTLNTLKSYLSIDDNSYLLKIMNILQGMHYINYMKQSPIQEENARGWLSRITIRKGN